MELPECVVYCREFDSEVQKDRPWLPDEQLEKVQWTAYTRCFLELYASFSGFAFEVQ